MRRLARTFDSPCISFFQSFMSGDELKSELIRRLPHKIDIGAVYNARPSDHLKIRDFQPVEKEIVFDIDMTDYDDVRTCCAGAEICAKCWRFMTVAIRVLDRALRHDFGFKHLLWVYSGRRGIHCWVSDPKARKLGQAARGAVAEYLQLITGGEGKAKKVNVQGSFGGVHPSIEAALKIVRKDFEGLCVKDQDILGTDDRCKKVLNMISGMELRKRLEDEFSTLTTGEAKWQALMRYANPESSVNSKKQDKRILDEIMLQYSYPRLDINVSKGMNHLLKSPFCVHPKTGRVCIPIDPAK